MTIALALPLRAAPGVLAAVLPQGASFKAATAVAMAEAAAAAMALKLLG